jgi:6,7-dimethyl-8-ribityllumazine synthase
VSAGGGRYAIAVGRFYEDLAQRLVAGAQRAFAAAGAGEADVYDVPGAFELPLAASYLAESGRYDGVACLGAVIRGETSHYDHICHAAATGLSAVGLETGVPVAFGVLTLERVEQAEPRIEKGAEAVRSALEMADVFSHLRAAAAR